LFSRGGALLRNYNVTHKTSLYIALVVQCKQLLGLISFPTLSFTFLLKPNIFFTRCYYFLIKTYILLTKRNIFLLESYLFLLIRYILLLGSYLFLSTRCFFLTKTYPFLSKGYILPSKTCPFLSKPNIFLFTSYILLLLAYIPLLHMDMFLSACVNIFKQNNNIIIYNIPNSLIQPYNYQSKITIL